MITGTHFLDYIDLEKGNNLHVTVAIWHGGIPFEYSIEGRTGKKRVDQFKNYETYEEAEKHFINYLQNKLNKEWEIK